MMSVITAMTIVAGLAVIVQCICALNNMTIRTKHSVRGVYLSLLLAAAAATLSPLYDGQTTPVDPLFLATVAAFLAVNKRRTYLVS